MTDSPIPWSHAVLIGILGAFLLGVLWLLALPDAQIRKIIAWLL